MNNSRYVNVKLSISQFSELLAEFYKRRFFILKLIFKYKALKETATVFIFSLRKSRVLDDH